MCKTTGGTGHGAACVFPFTFGGKTYTTCTTVGNGHTPWCATSTAGGENGPWGNCNTKLLACRRGAPPSATLPPVRALATRLC